MKYRCLTLFVTHYPRLAGLKEEFPGKVGPYFVSYLAQGHANKQISEGPNSQYEEEATQRITFLYKLVPGVASRSFGLHVARLAQVDTLLYFKRVNFCSIRFTNNSVFDLPGFSTVELFTRK